MEIKFDNAHYLKLNAFFGLINQIVSLVCGLLIPRLILVYYGSTVNGLVNSIVGILNFISLAEFGVGAVVQSALYKPLADNDMEKVAGIYNSAKKFFRVIGIVFLVFVIIVCFVYSYYEEKDFNYWYVFTLILCISISMFAQYFFGIVNSLLLTADRKGFVINIIQIITLIVGSCLSVVLIVNSYSIQTVKLSISLIYLFRPLLLSYFVKRKYPDIKSNASIISIPQKWNGLAQHIAAFVLDNTDIVVLTLFTSLSTVSVYSVYSMIVIALKGLMESTTSGVQSMYGNYYAIGDKEKFKNVFLRITFLFSIFGTIIFSIGSCTISQFVVLYTSGITDANYNQVVFGMLIMLSQAIAVFRRCYNLVILAIGHYKQTQLSAIIETIINITTSIILVYYFGLIGVIIGTIIALSFRVIYFAIYISRNVLHISPLLLLKQMIPNILTLVIFCTISCLINAQVNSYLEWILLALLYSGAVLFVEIVLNLLFNFKYMKFYINKLLRKDA